MRGEYQVLGGKLVAVDLEVDNGRLVDVIGPVVMDPAMHVALDEVIGREVADGTRPPTLRIRDWDIPLVVMCSFQSYANEIDPEGAAKHVINVVRRVSGGGAMFMEPGNCITYSLVVPPSLVEGLSSSARTRSCRPSAAATRRSSRTTPRPS